MCIKTLSNGLGLPRNNFAKSEGDILSEGVPKEMRRRCEGEPKENRRSTEGDGHCIFQLENPLRDSLSINRVVLGYVTSSWRSVLALDPYCTYQSIRFVMLFLVLPRLVYWVVTNNGAKTTTIRSVNPWAQCASSLGTYPNVPHVRPNCAALLTLINGHRRSKSSLWAKWANKWTFEISDLPNESAGESISEPINCVWSLQARNPGFHQHSPPKFRRIFRARYPRAIVSKKKS
jgi:hypothetical protein